LASVLLAALAACGDGTPAATNPTEIRSDGGDSSPAPTLPTEIRSDHVRVTTPALQSGDLETLVADNGRFAWALYQAVRATPGNLTFSPASLSIGLAMAYGGAQGATADQMAATLRFSLPAERLHRAFDALDLALATPPGQDPGFPQLTLANAVWVQSGARPVPAYLDLLAESYGAGVHIVDFAAAPEAARAAMNQWVSDETSGNIPELFAPGTIDALTALALTNAVYFRAYWLSRFDAGTSGMFQAPNGPVVATMMSDDAPAPGWSGTGYRAVSLPYGSGDSMVLVVPDAGSFDAFEGGLTADALEAILATTPTTRSSVTMPRLKLATSLDLKATLTAMGMTDAFTGAADFSGIDGTRRLFIRNVFHKVLLAVDQTHTEASAATGVSFTSKLDVTAVDPLVVDRPFLFVIRDGATGTILFLGRVVDPTKS
jgi:serpin B